MKKIVVFVSFFLLAHLGFSQIIDGSFNCHKNKIKRYSYTEKLQKPLQLDRNYNVVSYKIFIDLRNNYISPYTKYFKANVEINIYFDSIANYVVLDANSQSIGIDSIQGDVKSYTHSNNKLTIYFNQTYYPELTTTIKIYYHHNNIDDYAFYVNGGFVFTDCEPEGARKWFPCNDTPSDKALMELIALTPSNVLLGSNGILIDSTNYGTYIKYHWKSNQPIATYLIVISSKVNYKLDIDYVNDTWQNKAIPIRYYYNQGETISTELKSNIKTAYLKFSQAWYPHPFDKNGFATLNSDFAWGGMENQTLISLCPGCWDENLLIHEFAHQWFGDFVTCKTWADIWVNEGFATWAEAFWLEKKINYASYLSDIQKKANYYFNNNPGYAIYNPAYVTSTPNVNVLFNYAITYCKGAAVVHLLRYTLGDSLFFKSINKYFELYQYKSATVQDFFNVVKLVTGEDYNWFMEQWIKRPNHPTYQNSYDILNDATGSTVNFRFNQTNTLFYKMPVKLKFIFTNQTDTTIRVWNNYNGEIATFKFKKQVSQVVFDPLNEYVLKKATTVVGIEENNQKSYDEIVKVYPNPFNSTSTLYFKIIKNSLVSISLYDILGNKIFDVVNEQNFVPGDYNYSLDMNGLSSGVYVVRFKNNAEIKNIKINYIK